MCTLLNKSQQKVHDTEIYQLFDVLKQHVIVMLNIKKYIYITK